MRPRLQERHLPNFVAIDRHPLRSDILQRVAVRHNFPAVPESGAELFSLCRSLGLDHARTVLPLARETDPPGLAAIECLIGHPITQWTPPARSGGILRTTAEGRTARVAPPSAAADTDRLVVLAKQPNPKKPGTNAWAQYELWQVGRTVGDCRRAGLSRAAVVWDIERGFVTLGDPSAVAEGSPT